MNCLICNECYNDYVECGLHIYEKLESSVHESEPINIPQLHNLLPVTFENHEPSPAHPNESNDWIRIPVLHDVTSWKAKLIEKIIHALHAGTTTTTTHAPMQNDPQGPSTTTTSRPDHSASTPEPQDETLHHGRQTGHPENESHPPQDSTHAPSVTPAPSVTSAPSVTYHDPPHTTPTKPGHHSPSHPGTTTSTTEPKPDLPPVTTPKPHHPSLHTPQPEQPSDPTSKPHHPSLHTPQPKQPSDPTSKPETKPEPESTASVPDPESTASDPDSEPEPESTASDPDPEPEPESTASD